MKIDFNKKKIWGLIIFVVICLTIIVISIINKKRFVEIKKRIYKCGVWTKCVYRFK